MQRHLPYLPVVEPHLRPNDCHAQSPLLFWTILTVGSRRYTKDPTLIVLLGPKLIDLAKQAILSHDDILVTIQAFLCICSWPVPFPTLGKDITPMLAGVTLQMALMIGLHVRGVGQDFSRTKLRSDRWQRDFRTRLWALCITVIQR